MTEKEFNQVIERITYKPGFGIQGLRASDRDALTVTIYGKCIDAFDWRKKEMGIIDVMTSEIYTMRFLNQIRPTDFLDLLRSQYYRFERHEVDEWLRFDGMYVNHPHPELFGHDITLKGGLK